VEGEIAKIMDSASKPFKSREAAKRGDSSDTTAGKDRLAAVDAWLTSFLAGGEHSSSEVLAAGEKMGFDVHDLHNARVRTGAQIRQRGIAYWHLGGTASPEDPASDPIPETKGDESATTAHPPVPENAEMIAKTEAAGVGAMDAVPCAPVNDPVTTAQPAAPEDPEATAKIADDAKDAAPSAPVDDSVAVEQPSVSEDASPI
jgi:hypothetical protein